jgi:hypothetical protein
VAYLIHCWGYLLEKGKNTWKKFKPLDLVKKQTETKEKVVSKEIQGNLK